MASYASLGNEYKPVYVIDGKDVAYRDKQGQLKYLVSDGEGTGGSGTPHNWHTIEDKPAVVASGATPEDARHSIDALGSNSSDIPLASEVVAADRFLIAKEHKVMKVPMSYMKSVVGHDFLSIQDPEVTEDTTGFLDEKFTLVVDGTGKVRKTKNSALLPKLIGDNFLRKTGPSVLDQVPGVTTPNGYVVESGGEFKRMTKAQMIADMQGNWLPALSTSLNQKAPGLDDRAVMSDGTNYYSAQKADVITAWGGPWVKSQDYTWWSIPNKPIYVASGANTQEVRTQLNVSWVSTGNLSADAMSNDLNTEGRCRICTVVSNTQNKPQGAGSGSMCLTMPYNPTSVRIQHVWNSGNARQWTRRGVGDAWEPWVEVGAVSKEAFQEEFDLEINRRLAGWIPMKSAGATVEDLVNTYNELVTYLKSPS